MAEQLGEAVLKITVDDGVAKEKLEGLRQEITRIESRAGGTRRSTSSATRGVVGPTPPPITNRNEVRQFNLRGTLAALEGIAEDIGRISAARQGTRQINIGSSWIKALELLQETKEDIDSISASKNLNLRSSWSTALALLSETKEDIDSISASKNLNLRASWAKALGQLSEIKEDLTQVAAAKDLNLNASWAGALATLSEIDADLQNIAAGKKLNIRASWQTALRQLQETADEAARIRLDASISEGRRVGAQNVSPIRGGAAFPGSPAYLDAIFPKFPEKFFKDQNKRVQDAAKRRADILSNALIGGAFPALFGQGLGASLGGAAGGAAGGALGGQFGFGLSLIGTALGAQFDLAAQKSKTLGEALNDPIGKFAELVEAGLLSSKALERNAKALIESGRAAEAAALIQLDLNKTFAGTATGGELTSVTDELGRAFTRLSVSMTQFSSGPLTGLLKLLGARFENDFQRNRSVQIENELRQAGLGSQADELRRRQFVPILESDTAEISRINDEFVNKIPRVQKANAQANADIAASQRSIEASQRLGFKITQASTQGYKIQTLELQKQEVLNARNRKLLELKPQERTGIRAQDIQADAAQKLFDLDTQINELRQERVALATEEAAKYQLAGEKLKQELQAVQALAALSQNAQRTAQFAVQQSTISTIQGIEASVGDAQRRERELGAQIDAARLRGGDAGEQEAARLVNEQKLAAEQTRLKLEEGSRALTEAGIKLREDVDAAFLNLQKLRTGAGGLNQFLSPQDRVNQERQTFETLLPRFRVAQEQFKQLRGVNYAPEFTGTTAGINQSILQFIEAVKIEQQAVDNSVDTQRALNVNTEKLATVNADLAAKVAELNAKEWVVQVNANVPYDAQSQLEINRASSLP